MVIPGDADLGGKEWIMRRHLVDERVGEDEDFVSGVVSHSSDSSAT